MDVQAEIEMNLNSSFRGHVLAHVIPVGIICKSTAKRENERNLRKPPLIERTANKSFLDTLFDCKMV